MRIREEIGTSSAGGVLTSYKSHNVCIAQKRLTVAEDEVPAGRQVHFSENAASCFVHNRRRYTHTGPSAAIKELSHNDASGRAQDSALSFVCRRLDSVP